MTLWANRMGSGPADALMAFTASLAFDKRLAPHDVRGSIAHVHGLMKAGIVTSEEADALVAALNQVGSELRKQGLSTSTRTRTSTLPSSGG